MAQEKVIGFKIQVQGSETVVKSIKELEDAVKATNKQLKETDVGSEEYKQLSKELAEAKARLTDVRQEQRQQVREAQGVQAATGSYRQLNAELVSLRRSFKELSEVERNSEIGEELVGRIQELDGQLRSLDTSIGNSQRNVGNYGSAFDGLGSKVSGFVAALPALAIGALTAAVAEGAAAVGEMVQEFTELRGAVEQLTGATGQDLDEFTSRIAAIAQTFGKDTEEVLLAANGLSEQLTGDFGEALTAIEEGFIAGTDANGEFLDSLKEYSTQAEAAGLSTEEFVNILNRSTEAGIYSDKGIDTVKEFGLRIREQTNTTRESLENAFGKEFTQDLFDNINDGSISTTDALKKVSKEIANTEIPVNQLQTVIADTFGGAGEDAGIEFIKSLQNIGTTYEELSEQGGEFANRQRSILELNQDLTAAQVALTNELSFGGQQFENIGISIKTGLVQGLTQAVRNIKFLFTGFVDLSKGVLDFLKNTPALSFVFNKISFLFNLIKFNAQTLFAIFTVDFPSAFAGLRAATNQVVENIKNAFTGLVTNARITGLRLRRALSIRAATRDALTEQIEELERQKAQIQKSGQTIGEAFNKAYVKALDKSKKERAAAAVPEIPSTVTIPAVRVEQPDDSFADDCEKKVEKAKGCNDEIEKDNEETAKSEIKTLETKSAKAIEFANDTFNAQSDAFSNSLKIAKSTADEEVAINEEKVKKLREQEQEKIQAGLEAAQLLADSIFTIQANNAQREEESQQSALEAQLEKELEAAGENEEKRAAIEEKFAKKSEAIDKEFRKKEKSRAIKQAIINGALAATKTLATLGLPAAILPLIAVGLQTAANVAVISSQQFAKGGLLRGGSHASGNDIPISVPGMGIVRAEGGEAIINKRSTAKFKPLLSAINAAGGGVKFQNGGLLDSLPVPSGSLSKNNFQANQVEIINELRAEVKATKLLALGVRESVINLNVNLDTDELEGVQNTKLILDQSKTIS